MYLLLSTAVRAADAWRYVACDHSGSLSLYDKGGRDEVYSPVSITRTAAIGRRRP